MERPDLNIEDKSPSRSDNIFTPKKSNTFWVLLRDKNNEVPTYTHQLASDFLFRISLSSGKEQLIKCFFELNDNYLFCYKEANRLLVAYLDLEYAKIKEITQTMNGQTYFGIRIIKNKNYEDILSEDEAVIKKWFELFKRFCILSQFGMAYENVKVLGEGNFAKVFLVKRKSDKQLFAAKVFDKKAIVSDELEKKCLIYEVNTLRSLDNPYVMKLRELYEGQNYVYCVTEAYHGGNLLNRILKKPNGRFTEKESLEIMYRILKALQYLESRDIIHRDLKPENIIFKETEDTPEVVIVDFGFATKVEDYKTLFTRCGTPGYVAPEVLNDFPYNTKADVFSAGITFYILLTGCAPFYGDDYDDVVDKNLKAELNFNFEEIGLKFEPETIDLLKGLLKKLPKSRLSASEALNHAAFSILKVTMKNPDEEQQVEGGGVQNNLKEFNEKYKFNIKKFPKVENKIPDNISDFNTPMHAADHRVIKQVTQTAAGGGRTVDRDAKIDTVTKKLQLGEIQEEKEDDDKKKEATPKPTKTANTVKNALKGL